jgi:transcriptional regulator with XRE-family HTH domain
MTKPAPPLPSNVLSARVTQLRNRKGWTQDDLAARMTELGWSWVRSTVAKVELGTRQVTVDELVSLAAAFGVSPVVLLVPSESGSVLAAPNLETTTSQAWRWMTGYSNVGLGERTEDWIDGIEERVRFYDESFPDYVAKAERVLPGLRLLLTIVSTVQIDAGSPTRNLDHWQASLVSGLDDTIRRASNLRDDARTLADRVKKARAEKVKR